MRLIKDNIVYLTCYLLLLAAMVAGLCCVEKGEMHLLLNSFHTPWLDTFLRYYTRLAEWPLYVVMVVLPLLLRKPRWILFFGLSELMQFVLMQILKYSFIAPRPILWFASQSTEMQARFQEVLVEGITRHELYSFPSGHTGTFFVFFTCATLLLTSKRTNSGIWQLLFLLLAALGGFSRIYLCQHFLIDVCVGSAIGVVSSFTICYIMNHTLNKKYALT